MRDHQWIQATDEVVLEHLTAELRRLQASATSLEALACSDAGEVRSHFLSATKVYHPNRFARRPEKIRLLANEVYLEIKKAYDKAKGEAATNALELTRSKIASEKKERLERRRNASSRPSVQPTGSRQEQKDRRRSQVRNRLTGTGTQRSAQIRAATARNSSDSRSADTQEAQFESALDIMRSGDYPSAATAFKTVAVSRPSEKRYRLHMHYAQGRVLQDTGKFEEARAEYKRCLGLDASFVLARESLASLPKEGKKKSGLISKLFGK